jgi:hypothetical protein
VFNGSKADTLPKFKIAALVPAPVSDTEPGIDSNESPMMSAKTGAGKKTNASTRLQR